MAVGITTISMTSKEDRPMKQYELLYGYVHCRGKTSYRAGYAATEEEAQKWVEEQKSTSLRPRKAPAVDPIRTCPAGTCPLKRQKPWFSYRPIDATSAL
jgi:hypothetical protein